MAEGELCSESIVTAEKRRISPQISSPSESRRQITSDPSRITQLVHHPAVMGLAHKLAGDLSFVRMAKELLLSLQGGAGAEQLLSLRIWQNQQLLDALEENQLIPTMETSPQEDQHIEERMTRIMEHSSLKILLGEKEDVAVTRSAIIILIAYLIDCDNENETPEDVPSKDIHDGSDVEDSIIDDLFEHPYIENIACKVESGSELGNILDALLNSVHQPPDSLDEDCKEHFKLVKMAWEDNQLISLLLKEKGMVHKIQRYFVESNQQLRESLTPLIKDHPPMKDILRESQVSSVRGALTILIGYWSAKNMILGFDDVMGRGGSVGIKTAKSTYSSDDMIMKVEPTSTVESGAFLEPTSSYTLDSLMPDPSLVTQLLHVLASLPPLRKQLKDASFKDVAQQIQCDPRAANFAEFVFKCLNCHHDGRDIPNYTLNRVFYFWRHPSLMHLRRALKKSPSLYNLFKKLSDRAQILRLKERLDRIRRDSFWKTNGLDGNDSSLKIRVALSILIGYWSATDVTRWVMPILFYQRKNPSRDHQLEDLRDVEMICYWADSNQDLEGLKNVLASKYAKDSPEFKRRVIEIECHQKRQVAEALVRGYDNTEALITALLKGNTCILMIFSWFSKTCGVLPDK